jgi:hypothetical protein
VVATMEEEPAQPEDMPLLLLQLPLLVIICWWDVRGCFALLKSALWFMLASF